MVRLVTLILCCVTLTVGSAHAKSEAAPISSPSASPQDNIRGFLTELGADLTKALNDEPGAKEHLVNRGLVTQYIERELERLSGAISKAGGLETLRFTAAEVRAVAWFGVVPIRESELHFWVGKDRLRLMRLTLRPSNLMLFGNPAFPDWTDETARAFGNLSTEILRQMSDGNCTIPQAISEADYPALLPKRGAARDKTKRIMERYQADVASTCKAMTSVPFHRLTWRLGDLSLSLTTRDGTKMTAKVSLTHGPKRDVRLFHIGAPTARGADRTSK